MKTSLHTTTSLILLTAILSLSTAHAAVMTPIGTVNNNDTVTAIYGTGNPNGSWVTATTVDGVSVGLRLKERSTANYGTTDGLGGTTFMVGTHVNLDFTVSSGPNPLSGYKFNLSFDNDPSSAQNWITIDVTTMYTDNSFGTSSTPNGAGIEGTWATLAGSNTIAQNSQRSFWLTIPGNPAPNIGIYDFALTAYIVANPSCPVAQSVSTLTVVPEPSSSVALGVAAIGFAGLRRRKH